MSFCSAFDLVAHYFDHAVLSKYMIQYPEIYISRQILFLKSQDL